MKRRLITLLIGLRLAAFFLAAAGPVPGSAGRIGRFGRLGSNGPCGEASYQNGPHRIYRPRAPGPIQSPCGNMLPRAALSLPSPGTDLSTPI